MVYIEYTKINMKKIFLTFLLVIFGFAMLGHSTHADASTRVRGYYKKSGGYVAPHYRSSPNSFKGDNWSSKGNYNPYSGKKGYVRWY